MPDIAIVFLHGTTGPKKQKRWLPQVNELLEAAGYAAIDPDEVPVISPDYRKPMTRVHAPLYGVASAAVEEDRVAFWERRAALSAQIGRHVLKRPPWGRRLRPVSARPARVVRKRYPKFALANVYRSARKRHLARVLERLPDSGDLILVGYSLGSVVAADLIGYLEPQRVRLVLTLGTPLGVPRTWKSTVRALTPFPYDKVGAWVSVECTSDFVTGWQRLEDRVPEVISVPIGYKGMRGKPVAKFHNLDAYARHGSTAAALAWALYGDGNPSLHGWGPGDS